MKAVPVRRADDEDVLLRAYAVHLREDLVDDPIGRAAAIAGAAATRLGDRERVALANGAVRLHEVRLDEHLEDVAADKMIVYRVGSVHPVSPSIVSANGRM